MQHVGVCPVWTLLYMLILLIHHEDKVRFKEAA